MKNWLHKWLSGLGSAFPSALSPYWRTLPIARMKLLLAGSFLIAAAAGFCFDLLQLDAPRLGRGFYWPMLTGASATALLVAVIKKVRLTPLLYLLTCGLGWLGYRASHGSTPFLVPEALHGRVFFDAVGILVSIGFGLTATDLIRWYRGAG